MYKLNTNSITRLADGASIAFDGTATDYQDCLASIQSGAVLMDSNGVVMSQEQADDFVSKLEQEVG